MSQATVRVTCAPERLVPRETNPRKHYPPAGAEPVEIARTPHIERLLATGDLIDAAAPPAEAAEPAAAPVKSVAKKAKE
ncbi:hypothetical protein METUNv1_01752 [Methyloversatilis universalis FAM5]|uniref:Uncharacterized protein n=1 Tax=Methyloversatilis universalis (strain ATCC BAA-1314 / DSM 25237 / JCM 13912 / CCUG 52030 / FAM5) TaxID=1000565 RepID=F5RBV7_METUF|nr:hypothetical protein [Methyloversatilis universalis]EGK71974.1 hypothetical protein METUNv1_01752 [Methyloversatilis universalis FAM5]